MNNIFVTVLVVLVVLALAIFGVRQVPFIDGLFQQLIILVLVAAAIYIILQKSGLL